MQITSLVCRMWYLPVKSESPKACSTISLKRLAARASTLFLESRWGGGVRLEPGPLFQRQN